MSDARVRFLDRAGYPCPLGEKPTRFGIDCVNANKGRDPGLLPVRCSNMIIAEGPHSAEHGIKRDGQGKNGGRPQWEWDGNRESPTFSPSLDCSKHCGWHGYIKNGRCVEPDGRES